MSLLTAAQIADLKSRNPVADVAGESVRLKRRRRVNGFTHAGPCPVCSRDGQARDDARFECDAEAWVCAVCADGGDVIRLVMKRDGVDFCAAVARLGGAGGGEITPAIARRQGRADFDAGRVLAVPAHLTDDPRLADAYRDGFMIARGIASQAARYRERERRRLYDAFWQKAAAWQGSPVDDYLRARGLIALPRARLRYHARMPYFTDGREHEPRLVHEGPAMLAAIATPNIAPGGGRSATFYFSGLHITWLDPLLCTAPQTARVNAELMLRKGKARLVHPDTGEEMPAKKVRGSKAGSFIDLGTFWRDPARSACDEAAHGARMFAGEGIETVLSVFTALKAAGRLRAGDMFRSAIDLGNLGGRAIETVRHPTLKDAAGRARRVPGPDPDMTSAAMPVPDDVAELVILGDGDSDPVLTRHACERARRRHARAGRLVRVVFADEGADFNDMLNGNKSAHD